MEKKLLHTGYDEHFSIDYNLYYFKYEDLKNIVSSWYSDIDLSKFDDTANSFKNDESMNVIKIAGVVTNLFYAYKENNKYYLLDGFNRLLTNYGFIDGNQPVYIKIITTKMKDHELMNIMFHFNLWKLNKGIKDFFDRGMRLFLAKKFNINIYSYGRHLNNSGELWNQRKKNKDDFSILEKYLSNETYTSYFRLLYKDMKKIFINPQIINDLREIINANSYREEPFNNYHRFVDGYAMYLSRLRLKDDCKKQPFNHYLLLLEKDKKFLNKLQKMSWTDRTRQAVFDWFEKL